jgi:hypothetical protein
MVLAQMRPLLPSTRAPSPIPGRRPVAALCEQPGSGVVPTTRLHIADLTAVDPAIVASKPDRAVSRGQCGSVKEWPSDQAELVGLTEQRFTTTNGPIGAVKAEKVLASVRKYICPPY